MTYDQLAIRYLVAGKQIPQDLVREAAQAVGDECPDCGSAETESNDRGEYRCRCCDHRWGVDRGERYGY